MNMLFRQLMNGCKLILVLFHLIYRAIASGTSVVLNVKYPRCASILVTALKVQSTPSNVLSAGRLLRNQVCSQFCFCLICDSEFYQILVDFQSANQQLNNSFRQL